MIHRNTAYPVSLSVELGFGFGLGHKHLLVLACNALVSMASAYAGTVDRDLLLSPFAVSDRSVLIQVYGLPDPTSNRLTPSKQWQWSLSTELINTSSQNLSDTQFFDYQQNLDNAIGESLLLDGETHRGDLTVSYGINDWNEVSLQLPYLSHRNGIADNAIEQWHRWFGLENSNRDARPTDVLLYQYQIDGVTQLRFDQASQGLADLRIRYKADITPRRTSQANGSHHIVSNTLGVIPYPISRTVNINLKLPTGHRSKLTGSGSTDLSIHLAFEQQRMSQTIPFSWHFSTGILWMSDQGLLREQRKDFVYFANAQIGVKISQRNQLKLQYQTHSAFYRSKVKELGNDSGQLVLGSSFQLNRATIIDFYVTEDVSVRTAPDIGIGLAIKRFTH